MFLIVEVFKKDFSLELKMWIFIEREYEFLMFYLDIFCFIVFEFL